MAQVPGGALPSFVQKTDGKLRGLYGGAIQAKLPAGWVDASSFRPLEDNTECFVSDGTDQSIVFEIVERCPKDDIKEAARFHFVELARGNNAVAPEHHKIDALNELTKKELPGMEWESEKKLHSVGYVEGWQMATKFGGARNKVRVLACVLRLGAKFNAEILVQYNLPVEIDPESHSAAYGKAAEDAATDAPVRHFQEFLGTIKVADWGLFVPVEEEPAPSGAPATGSDSAATGGAGAGGGAPMDAD